MIRLQFDNHYEINVEKQQIAWVRSAEALMTFLDVNRDHFREQKGVYIIKTPEEVIYVGKAKNLYNRLYEHCKEMMPERCSEIKQLKDKKWIDAFSPYSLLSLSIHMIANKSPPIPQPVGSIKPSIALAAIAASIALPPFFNTSIAACVASG